jgi:hypothetical protein
MTGEAMRFILGFDPILTDPGFGLVYRLFNMASYIPYLVLNGLGVYYPFILESFFKMSSLAGDLLTFVALYEICLHFSKNKRTSIGLASVYFLNPFVIINCAVWGSTETLMTGFILLAILYCIRKRIIRSAIFLSLATFTRYLPFFLLPVFLVYVWRTMKSRDMTRFLGTFLLSCSVLSIQYLWNFLVLFQSTQSGFWEYVFMSWLGGGPTGGRTLPLGFKHNFTGFIASAGVWPYIGSFFGYPAFILLSLVSMFVLLKRSSWSPRSLVLCTLIFFALFTIIYPLTQPHRLFWVIPFLLLATVPSLGNIPTYYFHAFWISNFAIEPLIEGNFWTYFNFPLQQYWPFDNWPLKYSLSLFSGMLLLSVIFLCLISRTNLESMKSKADFESRSLWSIFVPFLVFSLFEILRVVYLGPEYYYIPLELLIGFLIVANLWGYLHESKAGIIKCQDILTTSKAAKLLYLLSVVVVLFVVTISQVDNPVFLLVQILLLVSVWSVNKRSTLGLNIQRVSSAVTLIYIGYVALIMQNVLVFVTMLPYLFSWLYLQVDGKITSDSTQSS